MSSEVEICNLALYWIGAEPISSIDPPDNTDRARLCAAFYPKNRDAVLRAHDWKFAIRRAVLSKDTLNPVNGYSYQYVLPVDPYCLRVLEVNDDATLEWVVEGRRLLSDESTATIKFLARVTDPGYFDSLFVDTLAARMAMDLAIPVTKSRSLMQDMAKLYEYKLAEAGGVNDYERGNVPEPTSPLLSVR